jgi:hypothetical protein
MKRNPRPGVELSTVECHAAGCFIRMRYPNANAFRATTEETLRDQRLALNQWPGPRERMSPIKTPSGEVVSGWILRPR